MTLQQAFDIAWNAFVVRGDRPGVDTSGTCVYRRKLDDGTTVRCAIGLLIPDEYLDKLGDATMAQELHRVCQDYPEIKRHLEEAGIDRLCQLQRCHDGAANDALNGTLTFHVSIERRLRAYAGDWPVKVQKPGAQS